MDPDPQHCIQGEQKLIILGRLSTKPVTCVPWADPDRCTRGQCLWRGSAPGSPRRPVDQTQLLYDTMIPAETCTILPAHTEICWSGNCKTVCRSGGWHDNKCQDFRWIVLHCRPHTHPRHTAFITPSPTSLSPSTNPLPPIYNNNMQIKLTTVISSAVDLKIRVLWNGSLVSLATLDVLFINIDFLINLNRLYSLETNVILCCTLTS